MPSMKDFAGELGDLRSQGTLVGFSITLGGLVFEVFSAHTSSPWTSETFGGDPEKAASARKYVWKSIIASEVLGVGGWLLAGSPLPLVTVTLVCAYMWWVYDKALKKAVSDGPRQWGSADTSGGSSNASAYRNRVA
jgi:hypothetical protein